MLSGIKFISRDQIDKDQDKKREKRKKSSEKSRKKNKRSTYHDSDSEDHLERVEKRSKRNKKWYSSDEHSSEGSSGNDSGSGYADCKEKNHRDRRKKSRRKNCDSSGDEDSDEGQRGSEKGGRKKRNEAGSDDLSDDRGAQAMNQMEITRREMGLDWMLRPAEKTEKISAMTSDHLQEDTPAAEIKKANPRELNPYLRDDGSGYPDDADEKMTGGDQLYSSSLVGDGGASWRRKSLKRLEEQAAREGRRFDEVMKERGLDASDLTAYSSSSKPAHPRAHLHAIRNRQKGQTEDSQTMSDGKSARNIQKNAGRDYLKDASARHPEMRAPKVHDSLSWRKKNNKDVSTKDGSITSASESSLNELVNDGSLMRKTDNSCVPVGSCANQEGIMESNVTSSEIDGNSEGRAEAKETLSANQLVAKAWLLRKKGKHEEADKLIQEAEIVKAKQDLGGNSSRPQIVETSVRYAIRGMSSRREDDDGDRHLAKRIMQNKQYSLSGRADDEYDFEDGLNSKSRKKSGKVPEKDNRVKRILTQQERCIFCFENPTRPKHLVVSIGNFAYLMLPQRQPVVPGHCCILTMQHDSATRTVDNNAWEEIRNFKKCLIMMFSKQEKELVFLETVIGLAQQRRHCLIECIPLPKEIAKDAPLYFKKAIDEAEDEWSQHNAKKLIDTSAKGLRASIPKDFPYFHVEFGLNKGFVHVIDDEREFNSSLGLNVIRGMLQLPEEDMYRRRRYESVEAQRQAVANFARDWEPYDWTKQL